MHRAVLEVLRDCHLEQISARVPGFRAERLMERLTGFSYTGELTEAALRAWAKSNKLEANWKIFGKPATVKIYGEVLGSETHLATFVFDGHIFTVRWEYLRNEVPIKQVLSEVQQPELFEHVGLLRRVRVAVPQALKEEVLQTVLRTTNPLKQYKDITEGRNRDLIGRLKTIRPFKYRRWDDHCYFSFDDGHTRIRVIVPRHSTLVDVEWSGGAIHNLTIDLSALLIHG